LKPFGASLLALVVIQTAFMTMTFAAPKKNARPVAMAAQQPETDTTAAMEQATTSPLEELTAWDILWMCDWFTWPFIALTIFGLSLLIYRWLVEYRQKARAYQLLVQPIEVSTLSQFVKMLNMSPPNRASQLFQQMIAVFNKTNKAESLQEDVTHFVQGEKDSFDTFNRIITFLSDTAGALGLLGTVWGIFVTFYSGQMDGPTILKGMSIALITTLVGLIISLILNMGATSLHALFSRQIKLLTERADELRHAMLHLQAKSARSATETATHRPEPAPSRRSRSAGKRVQEREPAPFGMTEEVDEWA
jgi:biopolymer transport protein ExbB/TolQ